MFKFHIQQFKVKNFKAFRESAFVELKPLTVFAGVNSSGKSSFIQGLLLLKQSLDTEIFPRLRLAGPEPGELFVEFTTFEEAIFGHGSGEQNQLSFDVRVVRYMPKEVAEFFKGELPQTISVDGEESYPLTLDVEITFRYDEQWGAIVDRLDCQASSGFAVGPQLTVKMVPDGQDQVTVVSAVSGWPEEWMSALDLTWSGLFPSGIHLPILLEKLFSMGEDSHANGAPKHSADDTFTRILKETSVIFNPLSSLVGELRYHLYYLESLRPKPRSLYRIDPNPPLIVSARGDIAFQKLWYDRDKLVEVIAPGHERAESVLIEALNRVLECLGIGQSLSIVPLEKVGFQLRFQTLGGQESISITNVGFGISQILPVLLVCLESQEGDTIIIEHPEIHLHPNAQALLADYFIELANSGRRLIVETHSHYFINRLVRRTAEGSELSDKINILFVRPPLGEKGATIAPLEVNSDGDICNWPPDFFPEPDEDTARTLEARFSRGQA